VGVLAVLTAAAVALTALISIWFLVGVPFLAAGTYAAWLGLTPSRFVDAVAGDESGARHFPF
jgi:hypothetical protein